MSSKSGKDRVQEVIDSEKRRDPKGFRTAEEKGELLQFLDSALKKANVNPVHLERLLGESIGEDIGLEAYIDMASSSLDEVIFEPFYEHQLPSNHMGLAEVMSNLRSSSQILVPLKRIKVCSASAALLCFGLAIRYGIKKYIPHSALLFVLAADLLRVSYNCYDRKYCSLYLNMIGGTASRAADTIFKFVTTMVGLTEPEQDPFIGLRKEIVWKNLAQDTFMQALYMKVTFILHGTGLTYLTLSTHFLLTHDCRGKIYCAPATNAVILHTIMSADYPSRFLLRLLLTLARDDPEGYNRAIETGNLKGYLASYIWLGLIEESLVDQYLKFPSLFYAKYILDSAVDEGSHKLDKLLFAPCHETVPGNDWGVHSSLQSLQSVAKVQHPLKKLKVGCFMGSFFCAGLSLAALSRGKVPSTTAWAVASADLIQISYNCYDKRYNELYLDKLGGNLNNICDTVFSCAKSLLQIDRNPIWKMCSEIDHTLLVQDTRALKLLHIVR